MKNQSIIIILNISCLILFPLLFVGVINKTKAFWAGRKGASIFQPFYDFIKLLKKGMVISTVSSFVFIFFPTITFASIFFAGLFVPIILHRAIISFEGSFILFAYILALGKFFSVIGAMDVGSSFEGMGASREIAFSTIVEPIFFIVMASIIALTGGGSFDTFLLILQKAEGLGYLIIALAAITFFMILLIEGCRLPVDDPNTHLELTMIHEVMVLDNSGIDLGLINYSAAMKMFIFASLMANLVIPVNISIYWFIVFFVFVVVLIPVVIGTLESSIARLRMSRVFDFIFFVSSFALIILSLVAIVIYGD